MNQNEIVLRTLSLVLGKTHHQKLWLLNPWNIFACPAFQEYLDNITWWICLLMIALNFLKLSQCELEWDVLVYPTAFHHIYVQIMIMYTFKWITHIVLYDGYEKLCVKIHAVGANLGNWSNLISRNTWLITEHITIRWLCPYS